MKSIQSYRHNYVMARTLQKLFGIYPGEERNAFVFACLGFLWAFAATSALKFADALFLLHIGADFLPQAYTINSLSMFGVAVLLLYAFDHFSSYTIFRTTIILGIIFYFFAFFYQLTGLALESDWFWYALKTVGFLLFAVLMTCYWTFIDQYHHLQDAKRLYSLFSSTIFLGAASTGLLMRSGVLNLDQLLILITILLFLTYFWIKKINGSITLISHEETEVEGTIEASSSFKHLFNSIVASPFTLLLMTSNFLTYLLLVITEYNYMSSFQEHFAQGYVEASDPSEGTEAVLTLFLGQSLAVVSVLNLIVGLFVYSRMVRRFGINSLLAITPILLIVAFSGWIVSDSLLFPLIGFFVVEGTLYVIDDSNFNLLLNAVPLKLKYKIRVMIESFFEPVGMLVSATLLSFFQGYSKLMGLVLSLILLSVAFALRSQYLRAIFSNLAQNAIHFQRSIGDWLGKMTSKQQATAERRFLYILQSKNEEAQLFACEGLLSFEDPTILKKILEPVSKMSTKSKIKFIHLLEQSPFYKNEIVLDTIQNWMRQEYNLQLKSAVHFFLAKQGLLHPDKVYHELDSQDIHLQGAAILALQKSLAFLPPSTAVYYRNLANERLNALLTSKDDEKMCMGLQILGLDGPHAIDTLLPYLGSDSIPISRAAAKSIYQIAQYDQLDPYRQAPILIQHLERSNDNDVRLYCLKALGTLNDSAIVSNIIKASFHFRPNERRLTESIISKIGLRTVPVLISLIKDRQMPDRCRLLAGRILGRLSLPQLRSILSEIIKHEINRAYFYFYHYHTIQNENMTLNLGMLRDVLITDYHSVLDFIIQLLAVAGEVEDAELLSRSLRSRNPKIRSQVVETLEKTCEVEIFRLLQPLVDEIPYEEKIQAYLRSGHQSLSLTELLDKLSESSTQIDQVIAATMKYSLNLPNWRESLRQKMSQQDEIFHHFAYELLES